MAIDSAAIDGARRRDAMSSRERLEAVLTGRTIDRVPVALTSVFPYAPLQERAQRDPNYRRLTELAAKYTDPWQVWRPDRDDLMFARSSGTRVQNQTSADGAETLTRVTTHTGTLSQTTRRVLASTWVTKPYIETEDDLNVYLDQDWEPARHDLAGFWQEAELLGDRGLMRIVLLDPIGMVATIVDRETFYTWMLTDRELVDRLADHAFERILAYVSYLAESGVRCVVQFGGAEYLVPPMASPELFDRYVTRFVKPLNDVLRAHDCLPSLHCHGRIARVLNRFRDTGYGSTHPVEPPPMGDVTPAEFKRRVGDRVVMIGNVQIGELIASDAATIRAWVRDLIEVMGTDGGLIVCDSATPWETPMTDRTLANYAALIEATHLYGRG